MSIPTKVHDYSTFLQCPYNASHRILESRFQTHLVKCRQQYKGEQKETCAFNHTHIVNKSELEHHLKTCVDRKHFERSIQEPEKPISHPPPEFKPLPDGEDWDVDVQAYNPAEYATKAPVLRSLQGASKAVRKQFRNDERKRLRQLKSNGSE
ncbi:gametocyte-specific factor 1 homolog [Teleopsis dalmanni]|uniref:gametocyte-specific factor 1 homolog n=1 Tax=Teleopsis dalmanni TaxID=139649 RepID=UPI0018CE3AA2|nr:gametocyte-specific factor 1 homolog [Teleopsis dalmanni]